MSEWISVESRLPAKGVYVLIYSWNYSTQYLNHIIPARWSESAQGWKSLQSDHYGKGVVSHWMPLPDPPGSLLNELDDMVGYEEKEDEE